MFVLKSKKKELKTFKIKEVEEFLENNKVIYCQYNNKKHSLIDFLWVVLKLNGDFKLHVKLHNKYFGEFTLKKYIKDKINQKY